VTARQPLWRRRLLPAFLALAAVNLVVLLAWTLPRTYGLRRVAERGEAARAEVEEQRKATALLRDRASAIRANETEQKRFLDSIAGTEQKDLLPTLTEIEELARRPGLKPGARTFKRDDVPDAPLEQVAITVPLQGSYEQLVGFLREVERSSRFLTIDRVSLRAEQDGGGTLQVELSTYLRSAPGAKRGKR
jgi:Tfp pilus assembly protein PilO